MFRFVARRAVRRLSARNRWVSRALVAWGLLRFLSNRYRERRVVTVGRGETLVIGVDRRVNP